MTVILFFYPLIFALKYQGRNSIIVPLDTDGTIILFLYPLIFDTKIPRD